MIIHRLYPFFWCHAKIGIRGIGLQLVTINYIWLQTNTWHDNLLHFITTNYMARQVNTRDNQRQTKTRRDKQIYGTELAIARTEPYNISKVIPYTTTSV